MRVARLTAAFLTAITAIVTLQGQEATPRARWNEPQAPFKVFGNTFYVGPKGVSAVLLTSDAGHVLIDGGLPESVPQIAGNIRLIGLRIEDVRLIVNSHVHYDHAGGIGELQRLSGATVAAREPSARVFEQGTSGPDDPQYGLVEDIARIAKVQVVKDGETLRVGPLAVTAHATGGHTPGGTSWTWRSCEGSRCLDLVYADSLTAISADGFLFSRPATYPAAVRDFEAGFAFLRTVSCDILLTAHGEASDLWSRLARREKGDADALIDRTACRRYAEGAHTRLQARLASEAGSRQ
jgi:metallo-beta-lactamase class B